MKKKRGRVIRGTPNRHVNRLFGGLRAYLNSIGWDSVVAGPIRVTSKPDTPAHRYTLEIDFLGGKKKPRS